MSTYSVSYLIGSLSTKSINRRLANAVTRLAPDQLAMEEIPIGDLPLYNRDFDGAYPDVAASFKKSVADSDAILFVTPEYNRSIPGTLKNAIDWASRPKEDNAFSRKPTAIIGTSPGKIGTAVGQQHLRSILAFCNAPLMNSPEAYIQFTRDLITEEGDVTNRDTAEFLRIFMEEFHRFISRVYTVLPRGT